MNLTLSKYTTHELLNLFNIGLKNMSGSINEIQTEIRRRHDCMTPDERRLFDVDSHDAEIIQVLKVDIAATFNNARY